MEFIMNEHFEKIAPEHRSEVLAAIRGINDNTGDIDDFVERWEAIDNNKELRSKIKELGGWDYYLNLHFEKIAPENREEVLAAIRGINRYACYINDYGQRNEAERNNEMLYSKLEELGGYEYYLNLHR